MFFEMEHCDTYYGQIQALYDISIRIEADEIISIIGANGAGKTTLMKCIMGLVPAKKGKVLYLDQEIQALKTHQIVQRGISYVPEGREIFPNMTVLENLEMGAYTLKLSAKEKGKKLEEMYELFPKLKERKGQKAGTLSGGEQQMVAIARGLMLSPKLLMLDEPSLGLAPVIVDEVFDTIVHVNKEANIPVLLVEQNAYMALTVSNRSYVLENGVIVDQGDSKVLLESDSIRTAYLGK
ncbi:MAG: ABC transporter ATP-binding protein [Lachnospiraceae bacterium]|nr:ABC transporter ATP-binding protein [Lachnospiraceae bacterium]